MMDGGIIRSPNYLMTKRTCIYIVHDPEDLVILSEWSWTGEEIYKEIWSLVVLRPPDGSNFFIIRPFGILVISLCAPRSGFVDLVLHRKLIKFSTRFFKIPAIWSLEQSKKGVGHLDYLAFTNFQWKTMKSDLSIDCPALTFFFASPYCPACTNISAPEWTYNVQPSYLCGATCLSVHSKSRQCDCPVLTFSTFFSLL